ncbi:hypothetical protein AB1Y20_018646 [Prymnesium parvum]|uniref:Rab3 GTPase-activating protein catalytic subunit n=1 Tax=Prymnesium parvum TaxID=97485 RepID=A0AB34JPE1_PRYPA
MVEGLPAPHEHSDLSRDAPESSGNQHAPVNDAHTSRPLAFLPLDQRRPPASPLQHGVSIVDAEGSQCEVGDTQAVVGGSEVVVGDIQADEGDSDVVVRDTQAEVGDSEVVVGDTQAEEKDSEVVVGSTHADEGDSDLVVGATQADEGDSQGNEGDAQVLVGDTHADEGDSEVVVGGTQADEGDSQGNEGDAQVLVGDTHADEGDSEVEVEHSQAGVGSSQVEVEHSGVNAEDSQVDAGGSHVDAGGSRLNTVPIDAAASTLDAGRLAAAQPIVRSSHTQASTDDADDDLLEIKDFSVATPWEAFIAAIEEGVRIWTRDGSSADGIVTVPVEHLQQHFALSLHGDPNAPPLEAAHSSPATVHGLPKFMREMLHPEGELRGVAFTNDVEERVRRWFGVHAFVMLAPSNGKPLDGSMMALAQGALNVALANCACQLPGFVLHEPDATNVCGRAHCSSAGAHALSCRFDVDIFPSAPAQCAHVAGLVAFFANKVWRTGLRGAFPSGICLAAKHTYVLSTWPPWAPPLLGAEAGLQLPLGSKSDPLPQLLLSTCWPPACLRAVDESDAADGPPETAPDWLLSQLPRSLPEAGALSEAVRALLEGWGEVVDEAAASGGAEWSAAGALAAVCSPLTKPEVRAMMGHVLAPSAAEASLGLLHRLAVAALGSRRRLRRQPASAMPCALLQLWQAAVDEARLRCERLETLPHVPATPPPAAAPLVQRRLQMLNCCVCRKRAAEPPAGGERAGEAAGEAGGGRVGACRPLEYFAAKDGARLWAPYTQEPLPWSEESLGDEQEARRGEGEDAPRHTSVRLQSAHLKSDMQAFKAANPSAVLEDFVRWHSPHDWSEGSSDEDATHGEPAEAAEAADEKARRSRRPTDTSGRVRKGRLSARMREPHNLWAELWEAALPVPAAQQRPLFDADREGQIVLHQLEVLSVHALLPQLVQAAIESVCSLVTNSPLLALAGDAATAHVAALMETGLAADAQPADWSARIMPSLEALEQSLATAASVRSKLPLDRPGSTIFVRNLIDGQSEVRIPRRLREDFEQPLLAAAARPSFWGLSTSLEPEVSEYVLHTLAARPSAEAVPCAHRMYVGHSRSSNDRKWRLAIALSSDCDVWEYDGPT